ncbi:MAG: alpha/beta hydrolase family protein [Planctomycetaceae bacterium]
MPNPATESHRQFLTFLQDQNRNRHRADRLPLSLAEWQQQKTLLRANLLRSWGGFPKQHCDLQPQITATLQRDGYRVEKLLIQTRPGIQMTANAYVPEGAGQRAAVLCVHGHWRLAKSEPVVQARCIGLAKLGFFVLMVDAFGAGERGLQPALGEYHGEMVGATLFPAGLPLSGIQVYENQRAVDYMLTRPEVDPDRIGITGCSGGGNQTMYAGAFDARLKAVVPVCSVGTYQAYLGAACCMCEVVPAAMSYTEEWGILSLIAPRALMVVNATRDAFQFSIDEAAKSLDQARHVYHLYGADSHVKHATFDWKHDYHQPMREAMYGWMTRHLKQAGDGSPIAEPDIQTEAPETLRCFPSDSRPAGFVTLPQFAAAEGRRLLARHPIPKHAEGWESAELLMREALPVVLGGIPRKSPPQVQSRDSPKNMDTHFTYLSEAGLTLAARYRQRGKGRRGLAILLDLDHGQQAASGELAETLLADDWHVAGVDLRATGGAANPADRINRAPDHNTAEWSLWSGRPLVGQWVHDIRQLLDAVDELKGLQKTVAVIGAGSAGVAALAATAVDNRISRAATVGGLASFVSQVPYENQRLGIMVPGILKRVGDVPHLAALAAPRRLVIAGGVTGGGSVLTVPSLTGQYAWTIAAFRHHEAAAQLRLLPDTDAAGVAAALR